MVDTGDVLALAQKVLDLTSQRDALQAKLDALTSDVVRQAVGEFMLKQQVTYWPEYAHRVISFALAKAEMIAAERADDSGICAFAHAGRRSMGKEKIVTVDGIGVEFLWVHGKLRFCFTDPWMTLSEPFWFDRVNAVRLRDALTRAIGEE